MKFKTGIQYRIRRGDGNFYITPHKRTPHYLYFSSDYTGQWKSYKKLINHDVLFSGAEYVLLDSNCRQLKYFCVSDDIKN